MIKLRLAHKKAVSERNFFRKHQTFELDDKQADNLALKINEVDDNKSREETERRFDCLKSYF